MAGSPPVLRHLAVCAWVGSREACKAKILIEGVKQMMEMVASVDEEDVKDEVDDFSGSVQFKETSVRHQPM